MLGGAAFRGCHAAILGGICVFVATQVLCAANAPAGASIAAALSTLSINPKQIYHVRDLRLSRGGADIYLTDGMLAFAEPLDGRVIAAVFTTANVETGDAEILLMPPRASERASLASFAKTPNLDEHFASALFVFTDNTAQELREQIASNPLHRAAQSSPELAARAGQLFQGASEQLTTQIVHALLGGGNPSQGFFYAAILGRTLGLFDLLYTPSDFEPITLGRMDSRNGEEQFELWTAYRPPHMPAYQPPAPAISAYRLDTTIHDDLSMSVHAAIDLTAPLDCGRVLSFDISDRLHVLSAAVDGKPVEVFQRAAIRNAVPGGEGTFLLIAAAPFAPGSRHTATIDYEGSVIRQMADGSYAVADRNTWYPFTTPTFATFDLTFHCPEQLRLVSTGELVGEQVQNGERTVHRKTAAPEHVAAFNLGDYLVDAAEHAGYRISCYANAAMQANRADHPLSGILAQTEELLDHYTQLWGPLPIHSIAVSPVPGYFGQGFAGMIYISAVSYLPPASRPPALRGPRQDSFFSDLLLPHEVAHQWWGNIVRAGNYRSAWLIEAMAEDSALQYMKQTKGAAAEDAVLARYYADLTKKQNGRPIDAAGPLDFGLRLLDNPGFTAWQTITYEKGAWVLQMLRHRLGSDAFHKMQVAMLAQYAEKPISNEDFRQLASGFVPAGQRDRSLEDFFDAWIYGTGIPTLRLSGSGRNTSLEMSGVDDEFTVEVPLACRSRDGKSETRWILADSGDNRLNLPSGESCHLPSPSDFLYSPAQY